MKRILIVEDVELNRDLLVQLLEDDYELVTAADGAAGVEKAASERPDLILMDLSLPVIDGWEATRRIKADAATRGHPGDRPHRACHERRRGEGAGRRVRRLHDQADRRGPVVREAAPLAQLR